MAPAHRLVPPGIVLSYTVSLAAAVCASSLAGAAEAAPGTGDAVAVVDGVPITVGSLLEEMRRRRAGSARPGETDERAAALEALVRDETVHAAARRAGYDKRPEVVRAIRMLVTGRYLEDELAPIIAALRVGDDEVAVYYDGHGQELAAPRMVRGALIRVAIPGKASEEKRRELLARAEAARAAALALPPSQLSFGSVAVTYSDDQATRYRGGDMGLLRAGQPDRRWGEAVHRALLALEKPGDLSPVVTAPDAHYIVKLVEVREAKLPPLAEVRDQIVHRILQEKQRKAEEEFYASLRAQLKISVNRELLDKVMPPAAGIPDAPPALPGKQ